MRRLAVLAVASALVLVACAPVGEGPSLSPTASPLTTSTPAVTSAPTAAPTPIGSLGPPLQVALVSSSVWTGGTTLLFTLEEADNTAIDVSTAHVSVTATEVSPPEGARQATTTATARVVTPPTSGRTLLAADLDLVRSGTWHVEALAEIGGEARIGATPLTVSPSGATPRRGDPAPGVHTPTAADVGGEIWRIVSPPFAEARFYAMSVDEALARGLPFAVVVDSARWRTSVYCGLTITMVERIAGTWPSMTFIHVEPFATRESGGALVLDPPEGPIRWSAAAEAWGLGQEGVEVTTSPWLFVVDASGRVRSKFQGIIGSEELEVALLDVTSG